MTRESDFEEPFSQPGVPDAQSEVEVDSEEWKKRNEYHPFSHAGISQSDFHTNLNISETALVNAVKFGGISWTHSVLAELVSSPTDLQGVVTDDEDDRVLHCTRTMEGDAEIVGTFSYFITLNPKDESYRIHVFGFRAQDLKLTGRTIPMQRPTSFLPDVTAKNFGEASSEPETDIGAAEAEGSALYDWVSTGMSKARRRYHSLQPVKDTKIALKGMMNTVEKAAKEEGSSQIAVLTKKGVRYAISMAAKIIGSGVQ